MIKPKSAKVIVILVLVFIYIGINLGGLFALFFASMLQENFGFAMPFYSSIIVTILMIINISFGFFQLKKYTVTNKLRTKVVCNTIFIILLYMILVFLILKNPVIANLAIFGAVVFCLIILFKSAKVSGWSRPLVAFFFSRCPYCIGVFIFRYLFQYYCL